MADQGANAEILRIPETVTGGELRAMFDWTRERRRMVVERSKTSLSSFLDHQISTENKTKIENLYGNVIKCFQEGGDLQINGKVIRTFSRNRLPAHTEYHIAKVNELAMRLHTRGNIPQALKASGLLSDLGMGAEEINTNENTLSLALAASLHDVASLASDGEKPQESLYKDHELSAVKMVDEIVDALDLAYDGYDPERFKAKVKLLIGATFPMFDMVSASADTPNPALNDLPIVKFLKDGNLDHLKVKGASDELAAALSYSRGLLLGKDGEQPKARDEMLALVTTMVAADHGAYALEPCSIGEVTGLWKELNTMWEEQGELKHRYYEGEKRGIAYLGSGYTRDQFAVYGDFWELLGKNPFAAGLSITRTRELREYVNDRLKQQVSSDPLLRFEGFYSPLQLERYITELGLNGDKDVRESLVAFSSEFSTGFRTPDDFSPLSTKLLKLVYKKCQEAEVRGEGGKVAKFFQVGRKIIDEQMEKEMISSGIYNLHIAPFAYLEAVHLDKDQIVQGMGAGAEEVSQDEVGAFLRQILRMKQEDSMMGNIYLTLREGVDFDERIDMILKSLTELPTSSLGISLGGLPQGKENNWWRNTLDKLKEAKIPVVAHVGLEATYEDFKNRMDMFLDRQFDRGHTAIHTDVRFDWMVQYLGDNKADKAEFLKSIPQSSSPLAYILTAGDRVELERRWKALDEYYKSLKADTTSNNCSTIGDLSKGVQELCKKAAIS